MALSADDCLYPKWRLKAEVIWPARSAAQSKKLARESLDGLITQGNAQATADGFTGTAKDTAARWYVGYLAVQGRLDQMVALPSSVDVRDEGSSSYSAAQLAEMIRLRDEMLEEYEDLIDTAAGDDGEYTVIQSYR